MGFWISECPGGQTEELTTTPTHATEARHEATQLGKRDHTWVPHPEERSNKDARAADREP